MILSQLFFLRRRFEPQVEVHGFHNPNYHDMFIWYLTPWEVGSIIPYHEWSLPTSPMVVGGNHQLLPVVVERLPLQYSKRNCLIPDVQQSGWKSDTRLRCSRRCAKAQNYIFKQCNEIMKMILLNKNLAIWRSLKIFDWNPSSSHFQSCPTGRRGRMVSQSLLHPSDWSRSMAE